MLVLADGSVKAGVTTRARAQRYSRGLATVSVVVFFLAQKRRCATTQITPLGENLCCKRTHHSRRDHLFVNTQCWQLSRVLRRGGSRRQLLSSVC